MLAAHAMANHAPNTNTIAMDKTYDRTFTATPAPIPNSCIHCSTPTIALANPHASIYGTPNCLKKF